jgi:DNA-binding transcriptional regulator YdaS (Cro superfamily)
MGTTGALDKAISHFGSQGKLAKACGIKQPSIAGAKLRGKASESLAKTIHKVTRGAVPKWELRPDLFKAPAP